MTIDKSMVAHNTCNDIEAHRYYFSTMTSTQLLALGSKLRLEDVKAHWLKFNNDAGTQFKVSQSTIKPKARYFSVCFTAPKVGWKHFTGCKAHVKAIGDSPDSMEIVSVDLTHSCGCDAPKRKRNYLTRDIATISEVVDIWEPAKAGNAKQFMNMTHKATGVQIKKGQANKAVRMKSYDTIEAHIGQYFWIPSLFEEYQRQDPNGTYVYETTDCQWDNSLQQFYRSYSCMSIAKHFWKYAQIRLLTCDGTFTRTTCFKHILLIATTHDTNNQIVILAVAVVEVENSDNWVWFKEYLERDFGGILVWMSDADKGIYSNDFSLSMSQTQDISPFVLSRCSRHLAENCKEANKGTMNEEHKRMINELSKSLTEDVYQQRLRGIRSINQGWAQYLDDRKNEFVSATFLDRGYEYRRWGKVTNNSTEIMNGVLLEARSLPLVYLLEHIHKYQREKYYERHIQACKWSDEGKLTTDYARALQLKMADSASKRNVEPLASEHPVYQGRVQVNVSAPLTGYIEVTVNLETRVADCPCRYYDKMGIACSHIKAMLLALGKQSTWFSSRYDISTYINSYSAAIPSMAMAGKLRADSTMVPPEYKRPAGRPAKKRKERSWLRTGTKKNKCAACGKEGHYAKGCEMPSTEC
jgi:SWIM zinc finger